MCNLYQSSCRVENSGMRWWDVEELSVRRKLCENGAERWNRKPRNANSHKMLGETKTGTSPCRTEGESTLILDF